MEHSKTQMEHSEMVDHSDRGACDANWLHPVPAEEMACFRQDDSASTVVKRSTQKATGKPVLKPSHAPQARFASLRSFAWECRTGVASPREGRLTTEE